MTQAHPQCRTKPIQFAIRIHKQIRQPEYQSDDHDTKQNYFDAILHLTKETEDFRI